MTAIATTGIALKRGDGGGPEAFTAIGEVVDITPPAVSVDVQEVTPHDGSGWKEHIPTLLELQQFTMVINFEPAGTGHTNLLTDLRNKTLRNFQLDFPDSGTTTWAFSAYVVTFAPSAAPSTGGGSVLRAEVTFQPSQSAAPTFS